MRNRSNNTKANTYMYMYILRRCGCSLKSYFTKSLYKDHFVGRDTHSNSKIYFMKKHSCILESVSFQIYEYLVVCNSMLLNIFEKTF